MTDQFAGLKEALKETGIVLEAIDATAYIMVLPNGITAFRIRAEMSYDDCWLAEEKAWIPDEIIPKTINDKHYRLYLCRLTSIANASFSTPPGFIPHAYWPEPRRLSKKTWAGTWLGWVPYEN